MVSLTTAEVSGTEGTIIDSVCVQAPLESGGEFESPLTVALIANPGTASELY